MILEIKKLLAERKRMTLGEIALHFDCEVEAVEPMMQQLVRSGVARLCESTKGSDDGCGVCSGCPIGGECTLSGKVYEYTQ